MGHHPEQSAEEIDILPTGGPFKSSFWFDCDWLWFPVLILGFDGAPFKPAFGLSGAFP
jgi:hypothetical protein